MELNTKVSLIEILCKNISFQVRWVVNKNSNEEEKRKLTDRVAGNEHKPSDDDEQITIRRVIKLSKDVMELVDFDLASRLPTEKLDDIIRGSLLGLYSIPSVVKSFETETIGFYDWWGHLIVALSKCPMCDAHHKLGWCHLKAMVHKMWEDHDLGPSRKSRSYKLKRKSRSSEAREQRYRYYSAQRISYDKLSPMGRTLNTHLCDLANSPSPITTYHGNALWFLKEVADPEESSADCHQFDYFCLLPRCGIRKRRRMPNTKGTVESALKLLIDRYEENKEDSCLSSSSSSSSLTEAGVEGGFHLKELVRDKKRESRERSMPHLSEQ